MRRGTPPAELFGGLLFMLRNAGTRSSMREVGDKVGAPAATVSQVEKGQRALKEPKISAWADALEVSEADLHELWLLSQGLVSVEGRKKPVFYNQTDALGVAPLHADLVPTLVDGPDLEPIYRLAERITAVLRRLLPDLRIWVSTEDFEPPHIGIPDDASLTAAEQDENAEAAYAFLPLPLIEFEWDSTPGRREPQKRWDAVRVPLLQELTPIVRRRSSSVKAADLEAVIRRLSGPERERVRGYIDAVIEQRSG
jgi:transcriptional regulator with XRE-family HTH domain